ncbi:Z1 domain-containing protein [Spiroplasma apis]|uniref:Putative endonuclease Z1 domain-containing protein n=1 Tax=Spiroplasma apis B31 TaxID=1276258 RepID=V5RJP4_SPIAP|nr:Z1 domain-containing protein [Spiroplasma apis]AHB36336.1 hypothetical protein SAPIS_v1c04910 [Spiroplasma apis B31]
MIKMSYNELLKKYSNTHSQTVNLTKKMLNLNEIENAEFNTKNIIDVISKKEKNIKVTLIGEVQSGKTRNLITLVKKVLDDNLFDHVIWLSGTNKNLAGQTLERYARENSGTLYNGEIIFYDSSENKGEEDFLINNWSKNDKKVISLVLKHSSHVSKFFTTLRKSLLSGKKLLLIDDECDYYSISTKTKNSSIKSYLENIISSLNYNKTVYLGVTATPYSNFNPKKSGNLFPDYAILLNINHDSYTGINWFNKHKNSIYVITKNNKGSENYDDSLSKGLVNLIFSYIARKDKMKSEMLVNIDLENNKHEEIRRNILIIIDGWQQDIIFNKNKLKKRISEICISLKYSRNEEIVESIIEVIKNFCDIFKIYILNSEEQNDYIKNTYESGVENCVVIGGVMISRGFTFENLTTEVMINGPKTKNKIDVLLQRARWFGYRRSSKHYIRIIMSEEIQEAFDEAEFIQNKIVNLFGEKWVIENVLTIYQVLQRYEDNFKSLEIW